MYRAGERSETIQDNMAQWIDMGKERRLRRQVGIRLYREYKKKESCRKYATKMQMKAPDNIWQNEQSQKGQNDTKMQINLHISKNSRTFAR